MISVLGRATGLIRPAILAALLLMGLSACGSSGGEFPGAEASDEATALQPELDDAVRLADRVAAERLIAATDPKERTVGSAPLFQHLLEAGRYEDLFLLGDAAFEQEANPNLGAGSGQWLDADGLAPASRRIQLGDLGGLDAGSCRSCHFGGGPDGGGTATQITFFRGDGQGLATATPRDPPHVMGLGYLQIAARQFERRLQATADRARQAAQSEAQPVTRALIVDGVSFGQITALPDGSLETSELRGVSPDLRVRPFGHKGRYGDLIALSEDSLHNHFGIQAPGRVERMARSAPTHLGDGPAYDPDNDGFEHEVPREHALLLAVYMAVLPLPQVPARNRSQAPSWPGSVGRAFRRYQLCRLSPPWLRCSTTS